MKAILINIIFLIIISCSHPVNRKTKISIHENKFYINDTITLAGINWNNYPMEGLLPNSRMVQGIFDDLNPLTRKRWQYPDMQQWNANRNTNEFIAAMPEWKKHGLLCFTLNIQGGSPEGYSTHQPWINPGFHKDGSLRKDYFRRLERILDKADELNMIVILGIFYFGQDQYLTNEKAVLNAVDNTINWLIVKKYTNILIEINNESNSEYDHEILKPHRIKELINRVKKIANNQFYVSTSFCGGIIPPDEIIQLSDFILLHGNGVNTPAEITEMINKVRRSHKYTPKPIVFNEDDHFDFDKADNNFFAATKGYASWGYFDYRMKNENFKDGFQSIPVDWQLNSSRKKAFFNLLKNITQHTK